MKSNSLVHFIHIICVGHISSYHTNLAGEHYLGKYVTLARRKGDTWYVASMAGPKAQAYDLPLSFLTKGTSYKASIYFDTPGERKASHKSETVSSATVLPIKMEPNGGHLMILETNK